MAEIAFYHLTRSSPEAALFQLLEKAYAGGNRAIVRLAEEEMVGHFDAALWTIKPDSFLPHGTPASKDPKREPILLTAGRENLNKAEFAFIMPGASAEGIDYFERVFLIFDGSRESQVAAARSQWQEFAKAGLKPAYWTQEANGRWSKKKT